MNLKETLEQEVYDNKLQLIYTSRLPKQLHGLLIDNIVCIDRNLHIYRKNSILAEELGHYHTTQGDILNKDKIVDLKQECRARRWSYERVAPLKKIIEAIEKGAGTDYEIAEYLEIDIETLSEIINHYRLKHGESSIIGNYLLRFYPCLNIYKF